jgi:hypothetical protein
MARVKIRFGLGIIVALLIGGAAHSQHFTGKAKITPVGDGVHWELLESFSFWDQAGEEWRAHKGHRTDGASIPRALWPIVGSPFTDLYVNAAIIHDVYCDLKSRDWRKVHRTFYDAMIADGVTPIKAKIMYFAVYRFGPKWIDNFRESCPEGAKCIGRHSVSFTAKVQPEVNLKEAEDAVAKITADDPSLSAVEQMAAEYLFAPNSTIRLDGSKFDSNTGFREFNDEAVTASSVKDDLLSPLTRPLPRLPSKQP